VGFSVQMSRAEARGATIAPLYMRRLVVMFLIGAVHLLGFWYGDILTTYALLLLTGLPLAIFCVQVAFSHWWLARFRFGPAEWVWRSLTYGKAQPLRQPPAPAPSAVENLTGIS